MRLSGTKTTAIHQYRGLGNQLWDLAGNRPSLDLRFADEKSLVDATTGATLVDFARASSGTYVGSDGLIKTATTNLLLQSEDFSTTWSADGVCTVSTDQILSPVGTLTADKITVDAGGPNRVSQTPAFQVVAGGTYMLSAYVKTLDINQINIRLFLSGSDAYADYTFASNSFFVTNGSILTQAGYTPIGDNWSRIFFKYQPTASGNVNIRFGGGIGGTATSGSFYIWGAQLEQSSTVGEYIPTTSTINSAPRFDHNPTTGESLGLLVEESRTNLLPVSEDVTFPSYQRAEITPSIDTAVAPDGLTTADTIAPTAVSTEHFIGYTTPSNVTAGTTYTFSAFVKPNGTDSVRIRFAFAGFNNENGSHNFTTGITSAGNCNFKIQPYANGWYRIQGTAVASSTGAAQPRIYPKELNSWLGVPSEALFVWGAQLEAGSFPTSYIPTEGTTVTRAADVPSISGANFFSWYRQDEGTVFVDSYRSTLSSDPIRIFEFEDGSGNRYELIADNAIRARAVIGGVTTNIASYTQGQGGAYAASYKAGNYAGAYKGENPIVVTSIASVISASDVALGSSGSSLFINGHLRRFTFWPQRLPNSTLQTITQ